MSAFEEKVSYRGIPIVMTVDEGAQRETYTPIPGPINRDTTIWGEHNSYSGVMELDYNETKTFEKLWNLARSEKFHKKLVGAAQEMFDQIAHLIPHDQFSAQEPKNLSPAQQEEFVDFLLSPKGLKMAKREDGSQVINYAAAICRHAGIPHYDENITYMNHGYNHRIFGFSETGAELTNKDNEAIEKGLKELWCYVNASVFDLHAPDYSVHGVPIRENISFGDKNSPSEFKEIEASINKLVENKNGDYTVTVPYASGEGYPGTPAKIKFDPKNKIVLYAKDANEASDLAIFWSRLGQRVNIARINERE